MEVNGLFISQIGMEYVEILFQQAVGVEGKFLEQACLVGVAHINTVLLECLKLIVESIEVLQFLIRMDIEGLYQPHVCILC